MRKLRYSIRIRKAGAALCTAFLVTGLAACGGNSDTDAGSDSDTQTAAEVSEGAEREASSEDAENADTETVRSDIYADVSYEESMAAEQEDVADESPYYGIMHVNILDINGNLGDSSTVYSFKDKNDPENAWSVTGLEIGDIEAEMAVGQDAAVLFHGDVIRDGEGLEFIAVLPDGDYVLKRAEGRTVSNTMSTFVLDTGNGTELTFLKDNCTVDEGAMDNDSGDRVRVYYADGGELGNYPLRVCALE